MVSAVVWHYWIGIVLVIGAIFTVLAFVVGYVVKTNSIRYPKR